MLKKGKSKIEKFLSRMGCRTGVAAPDRDRRSSESTGSEIDSFGGSDLQEISKTKFPFKVHVSNDSGDNSIILISNLKRLSDLTNKISERYPDKDPFITYYDNIGHEIQINDSDDFDIYMKKRINHDIYVSWINCDVAEDVKPKYDSDICDGSSHVAKYGRTKLMLLALVMIIITIALLFSIIFRIQFSHSEERLDQWPQYKKTIEEFCRSHTPAEECLNIIVDFLSFMSFDSFMHARK